MQLAPSLHRLGSSSLVNSYLIEDAGAITVIDAGLRGHWKDLLRELEAMGRSLDRHPGAAAHARRRRPRRLR